MTQRDQGRADVLLHGVPSPHVAGQLRVISRRLSRRINGLTAAYNLTVDHWYTLDVIVRHDGVAMNYLAQSGGMPTATLTKLVDRLVVRALAFRQIDRADHRRILIHASRQGAVLHRHLSAEVLAVEGEVLCQWPAHQRTALLDALPQCVVDSSESADRGLGPRKG